MTTATTQRGQIKLYRGQAVHTGDGRELFFSRKNLEAVDVYDDTLIAEGLDGTHFQCDIEQWLASPDAE